MVIQTALPGSNYAHHYVQAPRDHSRRFHSLMQCCAHTGASQGPLMKVHVANGATQPLPDTGCQHGALGGKQQE